MTQKTKKKVNKYYGNTTISYILIKNISNKNLLPEMQNM